MPLTRAPVGKNTTPTNVNATNTNVQTSFQKPSGGMNNNRYSQSSNKGPGKKNSKQNTNLTQPPTSSIFPQPTSYVQSRNLGTGRPKMLCTACGEYTHWRKDCPYDCHCDNCDSDTHATHMCQAPPKGSPKTSPQPVICIYCGSSEHRSMECRNRPRRQQGRRTCTQPNT